MKTLTVYPTFLCPFSCNFCLNKDKSSINENLDTTILDNFLSEHKFDEIYVSGGEPMNLPKLYFDDVIDTIKKHNKNITVLSYPFQLNNYRDDIEYNFAYDFLARPRALDVWSNLLRFPKPFDVTVTLTPMIFKYHPNAIFQKLAILPNVRNVELVPYLKNDTTTWNINNTVCDKFLKFWLSSQLNVSFINVNKEKMRHLIGKATRIDINDKENYNILPNGKLYVDYFNEQDIHSFKEISSSEIGNIKFTKPSCIDFYSKELQDWSLSNGI